MNKKRMKKIAAVLGAIALTFSMCGCSAEETAEILEQASQAADELSSAAESAAAEISSAAAELETAETAEAVSADDAELKADHVIKLESIENTDGSWSHKATIDGTEVREYDYTWNCDYTVDHDEVKNAPAEYYTGTQPGDDAGAVYIAHDLYYYPEIPAENYKLVNYDGEQEWAVYYPESSEYKDYIFATLPVSMGFGGGGQSSVNTDMMHSADDAAENAKLHITEAGSYVIEGTWHGQIWIDLGDQDDTFTDENAKVTLYLNGADVTCTVAPALVFYSVYECDNGWEDREEAAKDIDTSQAGARVVLVDGSVNNFSGCNIYRMLKTKLKDDEDTSEVPVQKKVRKTDAAFYSYRTMNIDGQEKGTGVLNVTSSFEGLDTELHLSLNGGIVNIYSQDDGINVNEDDVSVVAFNGAEVHILAGLGSEGDGVDSNGYLVVNGGTVISMASPMSDSGLDSSCGSYVNGGTVVALGSTMDWAEADDSNTAKQAVMNLRFTQSQSADEAIIVTDTEGKVIFAYDPDKDETASGNARTYQGAVVSCANFEIGKEYLVYVGGDVTGTEQGGIYDTSTVTGFSEEAVQQGYSGQDSAGFGGFGGGNPPEPPEGFDPKQGGGFGQGGNGGQGGEMPSMAEGETPPAKPEGDEEGKGGQPGQGGGFGQGGKGGQDGEMPSVAEGETPPAMPEGQTPPEGFDPGQGGMPGMQGETVAASELTTVFLLEDSVNSFAGVQDYNP